MENQHSGILSISVTGHRFIDNSTYLTDSIRKVLTGIIKDHVGFEIILYSALAEGSDQLFALVAQEFQEIKLIVPLSLPVEDYLLDFETQGGKRNFHSLLKSASNTIKLADADDHQSAYQKLGDFLVIHCDLMLAIWNGEYSGEIGGTGEVIASALSAGKPVYWIYSNNKKMGSKNKFNKQKIVGEIQFLNHINDH
jgi:hypothetical protein